MASSEHRFGECVVIAAATCRGGQDFNVRAETRNVARDGVARISVRVGQVLVYVEDRAALDSWVTAISEAKAIGDRLFSWGDAVEDAHRADRDYIAKYGKLPPR